MSSLPSFFQIGSKNSPVGLEIPSDSESPKSEFDQKANGMQWKDVCFVQAIYGFTTVHIHNHVRILARRHSFQLLLFFLSVWHYFSSCLKLTFFTYVRRVPIRFQTCEKMFFYFFGSLKIFYYLFIYFLRQFMINNWGVF